MKKLSRDYKNFISDRIRLNTLLSQNVSGCIDLADIICSYSQFEYNHIKGISSEIIPLNISKGKFIEQNLSYPITREHYELDHVFETMFNWQREIYSTVQLFTIETISDKRFNSFLRPFTDIQIPKLEIIQLVLPNSSFFNECIEFLIDETLYVPLGDDELVSLYPDKIFVKLGKHRSNYWRHHVFKMLTTLSKCFSFFDTKNLDLFFPWLTEDLNMKKYNFHLSPEIGFRRLLYPNNIPIYEPQYDERYKRNCQLVKQFTCFQSDFPRLVDSKLLLQKEECDYMSQLKCEFYMNDYISVDDIIDPAVQGWILKSTLITSGKEKVKDHVDGYLWKHNLTRKLLFEFINLDKRNISYILTPAMFRAILILFMHDMLS